MAITKNQMTGLTASMWDDNMSASSAIMPSIVIGAAGSTITTSSGTGMSSVSIRTSADEIFDRYALNEYIVEHRVQEFELMKLRETNVDYAEIIKDNLAKMAAKDLIKKMSFTK